MAAASYPAGFFEHVAPDVLRLSDIAGDPDILPVLRNNSHFASGEHRLPVINQLFGVPVDVPPSVWLSV